MRKVKQTVHLNTALLPKLGKGLDFCQGCRNHVTKGTCDILGAITEEKIKQCQKAGYSNHKRTPDTTVRVYDNRKGVE